MESEGEPKRFIIKSMQSSRDAAGNVSARRGAEEGTAGAEVGELEAWQEGGIWQGGDCQGDFSKTPALHNADIIDIAVQLLNCGGPWVRAQAGARGPILAYGEIQMRAR